MKVLMVNGGPHKEGCTYTVLCKVAEVIKAEGIDSEIFRSGNKPIDGCIACLKCREKRKRKSADKINQDIFKIPLTINEKTAANASVFSLLYTYEHTPICK